MLKDEDCDNGQGFLFSRPLDVAATEAYLKDCAGANLTPGFAKALIVAQVQQRVGRDG